MHSRHHTTVADPALANPAELRRRSWRLIGGTASCDQLCFRRSWFHSKQTSIRPSYSYKLIHIIYIVYFCFYLNVLFYGSSWSPDVSHDAFCVFLLGDLIKPQPTPTAFVRTSAMWSRDSRRSILRRHLVLTFFFNVVRTFHMLSEHSLGELTDFNYFSIISLLAWPGAGVVPTDLTSSEKWCKRLCWH